MNKKYRSIVSICVVFVVAYYGLTSYASDVARARIDAAVAKQGGKVQYKKVSYNLFTRQTTIRDISIQPPGVATLTHIDEIIVRRIDMDSPRPTFLAMDLRGFKFDPAVLGPTGAAAFAGLGYTGPLSLDISLDYDCLLEKREVTIHSRYEAKDVGALRLSLRCGNIDYPSGGKPVLDSSGGKLVLSPDILAKITMQQAELAYVDASLMERILKRVAAQGGLDVPTLKKSLVAQSEAFWQQSKIPHAADIAAAFKSFIENPRQLTFSMNPATPVPLGAIIKANSPATIANLLNLQVKS